MTQKLNFDDRNYRLHGEQNKKIIKNSLENNGAGKGSKDVTFYKKTGKLK